MATFQGSLTVTAHPNDTATYGFGDMTLLRYLVIHGTGTSDTNVTLSSVQTANNLLTLPIPSGTSDTILGRTSSDTLTNKIITASSNTVYAKGLTNATTDVIISASTQPTANQVLIASNSTTAAWNTMSHLNLSNIGTNSHATIDTHLASTSNPHNVTIDQISPTTNKGEILVDNGTVMVALPTSTNNFVLTLDSTQAAGVKWAAQSVSTFVNWTAWTPAGFAGVSSLTNTESKYTRIGNMATLVFDFVMTPSASSDTLVLNGLPLPINNFTTGRLSNMIFIRDNSDNSVNFGQILMNPTTSDRFSLILSEWVSGTPYTVRGQINYGV